MAIWSGRRRLGTKGLRCKIHIRSIGNECGRPAKNYSQSVKGWADEVLDVGNIQCCKNHAALLKEQGVILALAPTLEKPQQESVPPSPSHKESRNDV